MVLIIYALNTRSPNRVVYYTHITIKAKIYFSKHKGHCPRMKQNKNVFTDAKR